MYQQCLTNDSSSEIHIPSNVDQDEVEELIRGLISALPLLQPTPECTSEILPFLCFSYFGLCDSNGNLLRTSAEQCETIRDETCASEYSTAMAFVQLPQCELLQDTTIECTGIQVLITTKTLINATLSTSTVCIVPIQALTTE